MPKSKRQIIYETWMYENTRPLDRTFPSYRRNISDFKKEILKEKDMSELQFVLESWLRKQYGNNCAE